jgi:hypothetical protein
MPVILPAVPVGEERLRANIASVKAPTGPSKTSNPSAMTIIRVGAGARDLDRIGRGQGHEAVD